MNATHYQVSRAGSFVTRDLILGWLLFDSNGGMVGQLAALEPDDLNIVCDQLPQRIAAEVRKDIAAIPAPAPTKPAAPAPAMPQRAVLVATDESIRRFISKCTTGSREYVAFCHNLLEAPEGPLARAQAVKMTNQQPFNAWLADMGV